MKVLVLHFGCNLLSNQREEIYNRMVQQIKANAVVAVPNCIDHYEVVEIDTVAYNKGTMLFSPIECEEGEQ